MSDQDMERGQSAQESVKLDWEAFFSRASLKPLALPELPGIDRKTGLLCAHLVKSSEIATAQKAGIGKGDAPLILTVLCDVLIVDVDINLEGATYIIARRIERQGKSSIFLNALFDPKVFVKVATQEIVDQATGKPCTLRLKVMANDSVNEPNEYLSKLRSFEEYGISADIIDVPKAGGSGFIATGTAPMAQQIGAAEVAAAFLTPGEELPSFLKVHSLLGCLLIDTKRDYAIQLFRWIRDLTINDTQFSDLGVKAQSLMCTAIHLPQSSDSILIVPMLDHEIFADSALKLLESLQDLERRYEIFKSLQADDKNWRDSALLAMQESENSNELNKLLVENARKARESVGQARFAAMVELRDQNNALDALELAFEHGIDKWKRNQEDKALIELLKNIFGVLTQLPDMIVAGPEMVALAALGSVGELAELVGTRMGFDTVLAVPEHRGIDDPRYREIVELADTLRTEVSKSELDATDVGREEAFRRFLDSVDRIDEHERQALKDLRATMTREAGEAKKAQASLLKDKISELDKKRSKLAALRKSMEAVATGIQNIVGAAMKLAGIAATARALERDGEAILRQIHDGVASAFDTAAPTGVDVVTGGLQLWDELQIHIETAFELGGKGKIGEVEGGRDYLDGFRVLIAKSKSLCAARLALAKADSELATALLRQQSSEKAVKLYNERLDALDDKVLLDQNLIATAYERVIDGRLALFMALETYRRAFVFYAQIPFAEWPTLPKITEPISVGLRDKINEITGKKFELEALGKRGLSLSSLDGKAIVFGDEQTCRNMRDSPQKFRVDVSIDDGAFYKMRRIRIQELRVILEGLTTDKTVSVEILNSGVYQDKRYVGKVSADTGRVNFTYITNPWHKTMQYVLDPFKVVAHADNKKRYEDDFFLPTPFTSWTLGVSADDGTPLNLDNVIGIRFEFYGEFSG